MDEVYADNDEKLQYFMVEEENKMPSLSREIFLIYRWTCPIMSFKVATPASFPHALVSKCFRRPSVILKKKIAHNQFFHVPWLCLLSTYVVNMETLIGIPGSSPTTSSAPLKAKVSKSHKTES